MIVEKPWGRVQTLLLNQPASVRIITIEAGQETSEHFHRLRDEMWVVLDDGLEIKLGGEVHQAKAGDQFLVPAEQIHRIRAPAARGRVLEITFGYTVEDDVYRLADDYGRPREEEW